MITQAQELLLQQYQEKAFISAILSEESCNYYSFIKNLINIPLIVCNSVMVCINSITTDPRYIKSFKYHLKCFNRSYIRYDKQFQNL